MTDEPVELRPARLDPDEPGVYRTRVPWKAALAIVVLTGGFAGFYFWRQNQAAVGLREHILAGYDGPRLGPVVHRYRAFRQRLEQWVIEAAALPPREHVERGLRVENLARSQGLYLRIPASDASTPTSIQSAAEAMPLDSIPGCLGVQVVSARTIYVKGAFLMPEWSAEIRRSSDLQRLRVKDDELSVFLRRDLPPVSTVMQSPWFLLALDRGEEDRQKIVDVFLWDLRTGRQLLSSRTRGDGLLIPVRYTVAGVPPAPRQRSQIRSSRATDCSIAAQIKDLTGEPALTFGAPGSMRALAAADEARAEAARAAQAHPSSAAAPGPTGQPSPSTPP